MDFTGILIAVLLLAVVGVIVFFLVKGGLKDKPAAKAHKEHANHKHHEGHAEVKK
jgi:flagellar basal body-associated protein FliL